MEGDPDRVRDTPGKVETGRMTGPSCASGDLLGAPKDDTHQEIVAPEKVVVVT